MRILVIGGAGKVGGMTVPHLAAAPEVEGVTVFDRRAPREEPPGVRHVVGDVGDYAALRAAVEGHDALVFMAMGPGDGVWGAPENAALHLDVAVSGLYLAMTAAREAGIGHAVYTSSMSVYGSFLGEYATADGELTGKGPLPAEDVAPRGSDFYALAKRLGEQVAEARCRELGMTAVALRLCFPTADADWPMPAEADVFRRVMATSGRDTARAVLAALAHRPGASSGTAPDTDDGEAPGEPFAAFAISGDTAGRLVDVSLAGRVLGWRPLDATA